MNWSIYWHMLIILFVGEIQHVNSVLCPNYCKCHMNSNLRYTSCVNRKLVNLYLDLPKTVQWIDLSNNSISFISDHMFQNVNLKQLVQVDLQYNFINRIESLAFDGLTELKHVNLKGNRITFIFPTTFELNNNLVYLDLSYNPFIQSPHLSSKSLQVLKLSNCRIGHLAKYFFSKLPSLREVDISFNHLISLGESLVPLQQLRFVDYSSNPIVCNGKSREAENQLRERHVRYNGPICPKEEETFQKMVKAESSEEFDISSEETTELPPQWKSIENDNKIESPKIISGHEGKQNSLGRIDMLMITFGTGFALGSILTCTLIALCLVCCRIKRKRSPIRSRVTFEQIQLPVHYSSVPEQERVNLRQVLSPDPSAPPPPYNQLFRG